MFCFDFFFSFSKRAARFAREKEEEENLTFFSPAPHTHTHTQNSHHLVTAAVSGGNLYIAHVTIGDKRWFKGAKVDAEGIYNSFTVA